MSEEIITMTLQEDSPIALNTDQLIKGDKGEAATIKVGTVKTGVPGGEAKVTNSGNIHDAILDFEIPQGATGKASTITIDSVITGDEKTSAKVENVGTAEDAKFKFTIPKGDTGKAATISINKVETGAPGSEVLVTNTGTEYDAVLNITIPSGIQGVKGDPGKDFSIEKTYSSIAEMNADKNNITEGSFVIIASNTEDEDNSKLFIKTATGFNFLTDLSGAQGFKGEKGDTATIKIGTITTLSPASKATVSNVGTDNDAVFNFGLPQGIDGKAATVKVGTVETTNDDTAVVSNSGSTSDAIFDFKIPQGKPATITIGTVVSGSSPSVENVGTNNDAIFNFVLEKGDKGEPFTYEDFTQDQIDAIIEGVVGYTNYATKTFVNNRRTVLSSTIEFNEEYWNENIYNKINIDYPVGDYDIEIVLSADATTEEKMAWYQAEFVGGTDNKLKATGTKPIRNIPVLLTLFNKKEN